MAKDRRFTGLRDKNGREIYEDDIVLKIHPMIPERTQEHIDAMRAQIGVTATHSDWPHAEIPERKEYIKVRLIALPEGSYFHPFYPGDFGDILPKEVEVVGDISNKKLLELVEEDDEEPS